MTADETEPAAQQADGRRADSARAAYQRRSRRQGKVDPGRLTRTGSPIAAAMSRLPFVASIIGLLAIGIVGVLWLNTMSDATGLRATESRIRQAMLKTDIEALHKDVNILNDPARIAAQADRAGMVQPGDAAMLEVGADGTGRVLGTPTPVAAPVTALPATPTTAPVVLPPLTTTPATSTASSTAAGTATSATAKVTSANTAPAAPTATNAPASRTAGTSPAATNPAKTNPAQTTAAKITAADTAPAKTTAARTTLAKTTAARTTPAKTAATPAQQATTTGAGR